MLFSQFSVFYWKKVTKSSLKSIRRWPWTANWTPLARFSGGPSWMSIATTAKYTMDGEWVPDSAQQADSVSVSPMVLVRWQSIVYSHKTTDATGVAYYYNHHIKDGYIMSCLLSVRRPFLFNCKLFMTGRPTGGWYISHRHFPFANSPSSLLSAYEM